jgi:hypothetical protein
MLQIIVSLFFFIISAIDTIRSDLLEITDILYHIMLMVIGTDCIGSCKSNYHMILTMMTPHGRTDRQW